MPKSYPDIGTFTSGQILTAATMNDVGTNLDNFRIPPMVRVYRSTDLTGYVSGAAVSWNAEDYDTDGMFSATSTDITIQTAGIYLITLYSYWTATATVTGIEPLIKIGGTSLVGGTVVQAAGIGSIVQNTGVVKCSASNVLTGSFAFTGGSNYTIKGNASVSTHLTSWMTATWMGQSS